jgi:hypothetical protein
MSTVKLYCDTGQYCGYQTGRTYAFKLIKIATAYFIN